MSFARITRQALQPSVLALDPAVGRQQFLADLERFGRVQRSSREQPEAQARQAHDTELRRLHSGHAGYGFLAPGAENDRRWNPRYRPPGNPNQYMIDAILRDNAIAAYDREAPRLRAGDRRNAVA